MQLQARLAAAMRDHHVILIQSLLLRGSNGWTVLQYAQRHKRLEKAQLVLVYAHRIERADIQCPDFHVLHARSRQCMGRPLIRRSNPFGANEAVILVFDLQHIGVQLAVAPVHLDTKPLVLRAGGTHGRGQIPNIFAQAVDRDLYA